VHGRFLYIGYEDDAVVLAFVHIVDLGYMHAVFFF
jgi:hypothetical protein